MGQIKLALIKIDEFPIGANCTIGNGNFANCLFANKDSHIKTDQFRSIQFRYQVIRLNDLANSFDADTIDNTLFDQVSSKTL